MRVSLVLGFASLVATESVMVLARQILLNQKHIFFRIRHSMCLPSNELKIYLYGSSDVIPRIRGLLSISI